MGGYRLNKKRKTNWEENYQMLWCFIEENGRMPSRKETYCNHNIGSWYAQQKTKSKNTDYPKEYKEKLDAVVKVELEYKNQKWEKDYQLLCQFIEEYGRLPMCVEEYKGENIGKWFQYQKQKMNMLSYPEEYRTKIEQLSLTIADIYWEEQYQMLEKFIETHGHLPKDDEKYEKVRVGRWYEYQRRHSMDINYPEWRREKIEKLNIYPTVEDICWEKHFCVLQKFIEAYGRLPLANETYENEKIGRWYHYIANRFD